VTIRDLTPGDARFLRRMLATALLWSRRRRPLLVTAPVLVRIPQLAIYHRDWGRAGDTGLVAEEDGRRIGAVWYRFFTDEEHGDGYVDPETPELAIAVARSRRGRGVGRALMEAIHERARRDRIRRIALGVDAGNPARRLYLALGYRDYEPGDGKGRMILDLV
jgi:GNAT superfamily N-acetyltransferase